MMPRPYRIALILAFLAHPPLAILLAATTPLGIVDSIFTVALLELLPVLALAQVPLAEEGPIPRLPTYVGSAAVILVLGVVSLFLGSRSVGPDAMGLGAGPLPTVALWSVVALAAAMVLVVLFLRLGSVLGIQERRFLLELLPRTRREKIYFVLLSFCAGFGEELAFRGYAIPVLAVVTGSVWVAAVVSSVIFGLLHAYQGTMGLVRTSLLGMLLAVCLIVSGSLWPAMLAHTAVDLIGGLILGERFLAEAGQGSLSHERGDPEGVASPSEREPLSNEEPYDELG